MTSFGTWRAGPAKKVEAGVAVPTELEEGRLLLDARPRPRARRRAAADAARIDRALAAAVRAADERPPRRRARPRGPAGGDAPASRPQPRDPLPARARAGRRPRAGALRRVVRALPALPGPRSGGRRRRRSTRPSGGCRHRGDGLRRRLPAADPSRSAARTARAATTRWWRMRPTPAARTPSARRRAATTRSHRSSAGSTGFDRLPRRRSRRTGMELAIDLALQASPDHPLVTAHPEWFRHAPDGTIKYAENPPKKYQDIYPIDFYGADAAAREALWHEWLDVVADLDRHGVRIFRVDNPHTKPIPFWAWLIREVQRDHPDVIFLSEAFTRPKMMQAAGQGRLHPELHLLHVARERGGAARVPDRADAERDARVLPRQPVHEHAGYQPAPHRSRPAGVRDPLACSPRPCRAATASTPAGSCARPRGSATARSTSTARSTRSAPATGTRREHQAPGRGSEPAAARAPALQLYDNLRFENVTGDRTLFYRKALPAAGDGDPLTRRALPLERCGLRRGQLRPAGGPDVRSSTPTCRRSGSAGTSRTE